MPQYKKKEGSLVDVQLFSIRRQFAGNATYGDMPGDYGAVFKLLNMGKDDKLIRQGWIQKIEEDPFYDGKTTYECGKCGMKFSHMDAREAHGRKRHSPKRGPTIIDGTESLTPKQKADLLAGVDQYETSPGDFYVPDPEDQQMLAEERKMDAIAPIHWDKTESARK